MLDLEFDEISGTTFADSSSYANAATVPAGGVTAGAGGHSGKAAGFAGGVVTIAGPTKIPDSAQVWVEAWIQPQAPLTGTQVLATKVGSYTLQELAADVQFSVIPVATGTACTASTAGSPLVAGTWAHVAGWYDGLTVSVAINGALAGSTSCPNGPITPTPSAAFHVGGVLSTGTTVVTPFSGRIDELRVRQVAAKEYVPYHPSLTGGDLTYNQFVTRVVGATTGTYNGHITATANGKSYYGRAATTVICQQQFGAGARMCSLTDLMELMQANAIKPVSPDVTADVPATASSLPTVATWINATQTRGPTNMYNDCFNWSGAVVANGSYSANYYVPPNSSWPFGYTEPANCNTAYALMCCK